MKNRKINWLIYVVLVGLIPVLSRLLVWVVTSSGTVTPIASADFIAFGLVLHISNINEIEHVSDQGEAWKTVQNGISIAFIAFYSLLFSLTLVGEKIVDTTALNACSFALAIISFLLSYSVYDRITKIGRAK